MLVSDLKRNDVRAAILLAEERLQHGGLDPDLGQVLLRLQDDSRELATALRQLLQSRDPGQRR